MKTCISMSYQESNRQVAYYIGLFHIKTKTVGLQILYKRQYRKITLKIRFIITPFLILSRVIIRNFY